MSGMAGLIAVVAVVAAVALALLVAMAWPVLCAPLKRRAARGRPRRIESILIAPLIAMLVLPLLCLLPSLASVVVPAWDHCLIHNDHALHLCFTHLPAVSGTVVAAGGATLLGLMAAVLGTIAWRGFRSSQVVARLAGVGMNDARSEVARLDTDRCVAFTLGLLRPRVYVSEGLRRRLTPAHWAVVLSHERAHARRRDPLRGLLLRATSMLHLPGIRRRLLELHELAVERSCDEIAVEENGGDRIAAAETLLALERLATPRPARAVDSFGAAGAHLEVRVRALLAEPDDPRTRMHARTSWLLGLGFVGLASPVHHLVEHGLESWLYG